MRIWKSWGLCIRKPTECCEQNMMDCSGGSPKSITAERKVDSGGPAHKVSERSMISIRNLTRNYLCDIWPRIWFHCAHILKTEYS